jgi:hypothetical protein
LTERVLIDLDARPVERPRAARPAGARSVVAGVGIVLVLLAGGAAPPGDGPVEVASTGDRAARDIVLTGDAFYSAHLGGDIQAQPLRPGAPRWEVRVPALQPGLALRGPWLVVAGGDTDVTLLDPGTGQVRWQSSAGDAVRVLDSRVAVGGPRGVSVIDPATNRTIWSRPDATGTLDAEGDRLVVVDNRNRVTVFAAADGRIVAGPRDLVAGNLAPAVRLAGRQLVVNGESFIDAYRLDDLTWLWRRPARGTRDVAMCAEWLCLTGHEGLIVLDPRDGAERWADRRWRSARDDGIVSGLDTRTARVDLATGRVVKDLGRGGPVGDLMLHTEGARTYVTRLAGGQVLGTLPPVAPPGCARESVHLACPELGGRVTVWRIR